MNISFRIKKVVVLSMAVMVLVLISFFSASARTLREYDVSLNKQAKAAQKYVQEGNYEKAIMAYKEALSLYEKGKKEKGVLFCLERMGWLQREIGEYGEALKLFKKAYPLAKRLHGDAAEIDADLGDVYLFSGDSGKARQHYEKALATLKSFAFETEYSAPPGDREIIGMIRKSKAVIHARVNLGTLYYFEGKYEKALESLKIAQDLIDKIRYVANHEMYGMYFRLDSDIYEGMGFCHTMMGATYGEMGDLDRAWKQFDAGKKAFSRGKRQYGLMVNQALRYKIEFLSGKVTKEQAKLDKFEGFLKKADHFGAQDIVWRMCYELGRAFARDKQNALAKEYLARAIDALELTRSKLREDTVKRMFASSVQDVYALMINLLFDMKQYEEGFDYLERAKARAFLDMLAGRSIQAKKSVDPLLVKKLEEIQDRITLLSRKLKALGNPNRKADYKAYKTLLAERTKILETIKDQSLEYAATTTVTTVPAKNIIGRLEKNDALISYFQDSERTLAWVLSNGGITAVAVQVPSNKLSGLISGYRRAIASREKKPVSDLGQNLARLLIEPTRKMIAGKERLLIVPSRTLHYLPFSSLPVSADRYLVQDHAIIILPNASSLFFLDKKVTTDRETLFAMGNPARGKTHQSLPYAEKEVRNIATGFSKGTVLVGTEATESKIKDQNLGDTGIIHVAAHGEYNAKQPLKSALLLAKDQANDGNLETYEVFSLKMNPRLVVLSACQSGLGKVEGGDEVQGLNRAFLYAGAGGVLASLWSVADEQTYRLMEYFYGNLSSQMPAEALKGAQLQLMKEYPSPFYWAPFYLTGGIE
ncbi:CHAT domain-containing protein [Thermodesulfobacteriota bacterium]